MRLGAQPFLWKWVLFEWEWKMISISKAEHLPSFWNRGPGNSEMAYSRGINSMSAIEWPGWLKWEGTAAVVFAWSFFCWCCCLSMFFKAFTKCATNFHTGDAPPRSPTPYPFLYHFSRKRYPFSIPSTDTWYPFHTSCLELSIPFNCCKCTVF